LKVLILGGGLAGLAAGCELADREGLELTLIERRPYLGGRASSFFHKGLGEEVDLGQHVFLRCCSAYLAFLRKIGAQEMVSLQPRLSLEVRGRDGRVGLIRGSPLPGPLYLFPSVLRLPFLSPREKLRLLPALARSADLSPVSSGGDLPGMAGAARAGPDGRERATLELPHPPDAQ
jgi:uncharacterized protein with NAD-binding domain and iron-sulfur cluster